MAPSRRVARKVEAVTEVVAESTTKPVTKKARGGKKVAEPVVEPHVEMNGVAEDKEDIKAPIQNGHGAKGEPNPGWFKLIFPLNCLSSLAGNPILNVKTEIKKLEALL